MVVTQHGIDSLHQDLFVIVGGRRYPVTRIGRKLWMAENLDYSDDYIEIGNEKTSETYARAWYYQNDESAYGYTGGKFGLFYNLAAKTHLMNVLDSIAPPGWKFPSIEDIEEMKEFVNDNDNIGYKLSKTVSWSPSWNGSNAYGFNGEPVGQAGQVSSAIPADPTVVFNYNGIQMIFWQEEENKAFDRYLYNGNGIRTNISPLYSSPGYSIRLVRSIP